MRVRHRLEVTATISSSLIARRDDGDSDRQAVQAGAVGEMR